MDLHLDGTLLSCVTSLHKDLEWQSVVSLLVSIHGRSIQHCRPLLWRQDSYNDQATMASREKGSRFTICSPSRSFRAKKGEQALEAVCAYAVTGQRHSERIYAAFCTFPA